MSSLQWDLRESETNGKAFPTREIDILRHILTPAGQPIPGLR
jgi:hypothetical protein